MDTNNLNHKTLTILGCVPSLLNILFELAWDSNMYNSFQILNNIEVPIDKDFYQHNKWKIKVYNCFNGEVPNISNSAFSLSVVGTQSKQLVYDYFCKLLRINKEQFISLIHPSSVVASSTIIGYGLQVEPLSVISSCSNIGFAVNIKRNCSIGHHCHIEDFVTINPGAVLSGKVTVGRGSLLGSGCAIRDGVKIGKNSVIGIGSVVVNDIPANCIAYGNPCKVVKENVL